jgi:predicted acetyltransferase
MSQITYHIAGISDVEIVVDNRILFALELSGQQSPDKVAKLKKEMNTYFQRATAEGSCLSVIARCGGEVAGIGSVHYRQMPGNFKNPSGRWGYIMNMYTIPKFRRKGVCKGILNELVSESRKKGITALELHATRAGEVVYRQNGFQVHDEPTLRMYI